MNQRRKPTAAMNAVAYVHLTGEIPARLHPQTRMDMDRMIGPDKVVMPEHVAAVESHPMVVKVRQLVSDGWQIDPDMGHREVRDGVRLIRPGQGRNAEITVYPKGYHSRVFGIPLTGPAEVPLHVRIDE